MCRREMNRKEQRDGRGWVPAGLTITYPSTRQPDTRLIFCFWRVQPFAGRRRYHVAVDKAPSRIFPPSSHELQKKVQNSDWPRRMCKARQFCAPTADRLPICEPAWRAPGAHPQLGRWSTSLWPGLESHPEVHAARGVRRPRWRCPDDRLGGSTDSSSVVCG